MNNLDELEQQVINDRKNLSTKQQLMINEYVETNSVNAIVAWAMWFFLGQFGGHRFLFKKNKAILMLVLELIGIITTIIVIGFFILTAIVIWWIIDAFSIPTWIKERRLEATVKAISVVTGKSTKEFNQNEGSSSNEADKNKEDQPAQDSQPEKKQSEFESIDDTDGDFTDFSKPKE